MTPSLLIRLSAVTVLAGILALTPACSGGDGSSSTGSGALPDACSLLSTAEVESLLGVPVLGEAEAVSTAGGDLRRCAWKRKYTDVLRNDEIVLSIASSAVYPADGSPSAIVGAMPYSIGEEGRLLDQTRGVQAQWKKGALSATYRYALLGAFTGDFEPLRTRAKELAQAANGRM